MELVGQDMHPCVNRILQFAIHLVSWSKTLSDGLAIPIVFCSSSIEAILDLVDDGVQARARHHSFDQLFQKRFATREDISNAREQQEMLGLMKEYELDSVEVLDELLARLLATTLRPQDNADKPLTMLEDCEAGRLYPGRRIIDGFLDEGMDEEDVKILRTLQWFQLLPGHWALTFRALAKVLVGCLRECLLPHH